MKAKYTAAAVFFIIILCISSAFAEDYTYIDGENIYNTTVEEISGGKFFLNPSELIQEGVNSLFKEIRESRAEMINLLVIAALSAVLQILKTTGEEKEVSETAFFACFTLMTVSALKIFSVTVGYGMSIVTQTCEFVTNLSPVFAALIVSGGGTVSAAAFRPVLSAAVYVMTLLVENCIVPMIYSSAVLGIVGHITERLKISALTNLIRSAAKWLLMASLTVFTGVTAIYGFSAPAFDQVAVKGIKFAVGSFVPVVGGILSETVETVLSGTHLMKNAVGTAGIISLAACCAIPIIKIFAIYLMLRISAAAAEPVTDKRISDMLGEIAASVSLVLAMVITASVLFIICIAIILGAT